MLSRFTRPDLLSDLLNAETRRRQICTRPSYYLKRKASEKSVSKNGNESSLNAFSVDAFPIKRVDLRMCLR